MPSPALLLQSNSELNRKRTDFKKSQNNSNDASSAASMLNSFSHEELKMIRKPVSSTGNSKSGQKGWTPIGRVWPIKEQESRKGAVFQKELGNENLEIVARWVSLFWATLLGSWWSRRRIGNPPIVCVRVLPIWRSVYYHCVCCVTVLSGCIVCVSQVYCTVYLCVGALSVCMRPGERSLNSSS